MAVACGYPHLRIYDRRQLSTGRPGGAPATAAPLLSLAPPHLTLRPPAGRLHATYVRFSNRGERVVATYHGDHAYCFDVTTGGGGHVLYPRPSTAARSPASASSSSECSSSSAAAGDSGAGGASTSACSGSAAATSSSGGSTSGLPPAAERLKQAGNHALFSDDGHAAVDFFSRAIHLAPGCAVLYAQRGAAYLARAFDGDAAYALADLDTAINLDPGCVNAYYRRLQVSSAEQRSLCHCSRRVN